MSNPFTDVIIIRGAPGSGKTETSKFLAAHFRKGARVEVDTLRSMVISADWTNQAEHMSILSLSTGVVSGFLRLGCKPVILVDTFSGDKLPKFLAELRGLDSTLHVRSFALVVATEVLRARVEGRPEGHFKNLSVCQEINGELIGNLQPAECIIDNTELTPAATAETIISSLARAQWRVRPQP